MVAQGGRANQVEGVIGGLENIRNAPADGVALLTFFRSFVSVFLLLV